MIVVGPVACGQGVIATACLTVRITNLGDATGDGSCRLISAGTLGEFFPVSGIAPGTSIVTTALWNDQLPDPPIFSGALRARVADVGDGRRPIARCRRLRRGKRRVVWHRLRSARDRRAVREDVWHRRSPLAAVLPGCRHARARPPRCVLPGRSDDNVAVLRERQFRDGRSSPVTASERALRGPVAVPAACTGEPGPVVRDLRMRRDPRRRRRWPSGRGMERRAGELGRGSSRPERSCRSGPSRSSAGTRTIASSRAPSRPWLPASSRGVRTSSRPPLDARACMPGRLHRESSSRTPPLVGYETRRSPRGRRAARLRGASARCGCG